jgi:hypothetical protein
MKKMKDYGISPKKVPDPGSKIQDPKKIHPGSRG